KVPFSVQTTSTPSEMQCVFLGQLALHIGHDMDLDHPFAYRTLAMV
ncbi:MAG: hypothetical protein ACI9ON_003535, partial [Limisphaerales bacterium]